MISKKIEMKANIIRYVFDDVFYTNNVHKILFKWVWKNVSFFSYMAKKEEKKFQTLRILLSSTKLPKLYFVKMHITLHVNKVKSTQSLR